MKTIIIGGVAGGATTLARLRRIDEKSEIILFEKGEYVSYANCGLPYHIGGSITDRDALFVQTADKLKERFNAEIRTLSEVIAIDTTNKNITVKNLQTNKEYKETYDKLVISTGAEPVKPPIKGIESNRIFSLRNVPDMDKIKSYIAERDVKKAVVVGGGFIGLEMVENLHELGISVCIIERNNQVMTPIDPAMASIVHQHLKSKKIGLLLNQNVTQFVEKQNSIEVKLDNNQSVDTDMVILSIGVKPDVKLAKDAGLTLGEMGGIKVNEYMQTSDDDIYALGDATEVYSPILNKHILIPLAGPANKQGRIVADNIVEGNTHKYTGSIGTSIAKVFDLTVAAAGVSSKVLDNEKIAYIDSYSHSSSHAGYYPKALPMTIKISFSPTDGRLLGAQVVGYDGVDKRIDLLAQVIKNKGTIYDLQEIEHAYAPPYSSAKDPVNIAGFIAENILTKRVNNIHWNQITNNQEESILIDTRTKEEYQMGHINNAINIPINELRNRISEIPNDKKIILYCSVGLRGYIASRILLQTGYKEVYNLSGGYKTYTTATATQSTQTPYFETEKIQKEMQNTKANTSTITIDACGLQCPGPIMQLKKNYDKIAEGDRIEIKVTDQAFGEDLKGWCRMIGAKMIDINNSGGIITATIQKEKPQSCIVKSLSTVPDNKTIVVFSDDLDRALAAFVIANGAAASGKKVTLFFTFWGLNVIKKTNKPKVEKDLIGKMFGMMMPSSSKKLSLSQMNMGGLGSKMMRYVMKDKKIDSLETLMQQAIENGVEMIACSMSMDVMGVKKEELIDNITVGGVAAYLDRAEDANVNLFI